MFSQYLQNRKRKQMPKPKLPDELKKAKVFQIRCFQTDIEMMQMMAKYRKYPSVARYIRSLIIEDYEAAMGKYGIPELPKKTRK